ncbi:uncharacterized protein [Arachis hypogaea]|uniref:uncharacterized protein isoform X1 n=1 Tax=Arachis hypogaea TaxID=3818 RepID=UPI000A2C2FC0|nr:uncharacterized protein LOC112801553 isoform X1 [Arachis hypogaea]
MHSLHAASLRYPSSTSCSWSSISASFACLVIIAKLICLSFVHSKTIFSCFTLVVSPIQKASLIEKSRQKPQERIKTLTNAVGNNSYDHDPVLAACGIYVEKTRVLEPPKTLLQPSHIDYWAVVNFSARCEMIMRIFLDFYESSDKCKPSQVIVFKFHLITFTFNLHPIIYGLQVN